MTNTFGAVILDSGRLEDFQNTRTVALNGPTLSAFTAEGTGCFRIILCTDEAVGVLLCAF